MYNITSSSFEEKKISDVTVNDIFEERVRSNMRFAFGVLSALAVAVATRTTLDTNDLTALKKEKDMSYSECK